MKYEERIKFLAKEFDVTQDSAKEMLRQINIIKELDTLKKEVKDLIKEEKPAKKTCKSCIWLSDNRCSIGNECINPNKKFYSRTAKWKRKSCPACTLYEERTD